MSEVVIRVFRVSGYVTGPCPKCSKEERGLVMFEDYALGWECLSCGEIGRVDRVEWIEGNVAAADPALSGECKIVTGAFYLGPEIARLTTAILECPIPGRVGAFYRTAKFRELFCTAIHHYLTGDELARSINDDRLPWDPRLRSPPRPCLAISRSPLSARSDMSASSLG